MLFFTHLRLLPPSARKGEPLLGLRIKLRAVEESHGEQIHQPGLQRKGHHVVSIDQWREGKKGGGMRTDPSDQALRRGGRGYLPERDFRSHFLQRRFDDGCFRQRIRVLRPVPESFKTTTARCCGSIFPQAHADGAHTSLVHVEHNRCPDDKGV